MKTNKFYEKLNMGDCTVHYFDKKEYFKAIEETKPQTIPENKKLMLDPFKGYILVDDNAEDLIKR